MGAFSHEPLPPQDLSENPTSDLGCRVLAHPSVTGAVLAFFIECACPPDRRSATVGAGDIGSVEEFLEDYSLTHIVCDACNTYYRLIGFIDDSGVERRVGASTPPPAFARRNGRTVRAHEPPT